MLIQFSDMEKGTDSTQTETIKKLSKEAINELPLIAWDGPIKVLNTREEMEAATAELLDQKHLGFDTETRPTFKKGDYYPPALVQLATSSTVYLYRISQSQTIEPLIPIFESESILKTGVALKDDVKELRAVTDFDAKGFFEITELTARLKIESRGLRALAGLLMGGRISKAAQVSNWAKQELDEKQLRYAATDAWVSRELYIKANLLDENESAKIAD